MKTLLICMVGYSIGYLTRWVWKKISRPSKPEPLSQQELVDYQDPNAPPKGVPNWLPPRGW